MIKLSNNQNESIYLLSYYSPKFIWLLKDVDKDLLNGFVLTNYVEN